MVACIPTIVFNANILKQIFNGRSEGFMLILIFPTATSEWIFIGKRSA